MTQGKTKVELNKDGEPRLDFVKPFKVAKYVYLDLVSDQKKVVFTVDEADSRRIKSVKVSSETFSHITEDVIKTLYAI